MTFRRLIRYILKYKDKVVFALCLSVLIALCNLILLSIVGPVADTLFSAMQSAAKGTADDPGEPSPDEEAQALDVGSPPLETLAKVPGGSFLRLKLEQWKREYEELAIENRMGAILVVTVLLIVFAFIKFVLSFLQRRTTGRVSQRVNFDITNQLYDKMLSQSVGYFSRSGVAHIMSRFANDVESISRGVKALSAQVLLQPLNLVAYVFIMAAINWQLAIVSIVLFPVLFGAVLGVGKRIKHRVGKGLAAKANLMTYIQETLQGMRIVQVFTGEDYERTRFQKENKGYLRHTFKVVKWRALIAPLIELLGFCAGAVCIVVAAHFVSKGQMTPGNFFVFYVALFRTTDPIRKLSSANNDMQAGLAGAERVFALFDMEPLISEVPHARTCPRLADSIELSDVSFSYDGKTDVLKDVSLSINKGQTVAIVGLSGAGKSTLVSLIPRFNAPRAGTITIDGVDIQETTLKSLRRQVAIVPQQTILFNDTVARNIAYGEENPPMDRVREAADKAHAAEFIEKLSDGYETRLGRDGVELSGGEGQRIAIARAIYRDPAILILDEATSNLDSHSETLIQQALEKFLKGRTTFVIAHRLSTILKADQIVLLEEGRVSAKGTHAELLESSPLYRSIYEKQFKSL